MDSSGNVQNLGGGGKQLAAPTAKRRFGVSADNKGPGYYLKRDWQLYLLLLLPLAFALLFKYASLFGLVISFKDYKIARGFWGSDWVGFKIFQDIFAHRDFVKALRNTLLLNTLDLVCSFAMPVILAILLTEVYSLVYKRITQTLLYLPYFLSWVIIGAIAYQILGESNGAVNNIIQMLGGTRVPFLQENVHWLFSYILIGVWQSMGWGTIIYLAAISAINPELYEAATVDGAGRWRKIWHVTLPCIRGTIIVLLIMNLGKLMGGSFERIYALQNKATTEFTTTIPVLVYRWGIQGNQMSRATALGLFQSLIGLGLVLMSDFMAKRLGEDGLL